MTDPDERIRRYLRSRADVPVPDDLRWPSAHTARRPRLALRTSVRWAGLAAAVIVAAVVVRQAAISGPPPSGTSPSPAAPTAPAVVTVSPPVEAPFPSSAAGLPVVTVAQADHLLQDGSLDGRAIAVAGYFFQMFPSCPGPAGYVGQLERWCRFVAFADDAASATLCVNSMSCDGPPTGTSLAPFFMPETSGALPEASGQEPMPLVLIGHAGDARQWQCAADTQDACGQAFVVDRIAWADGHEVPFGAPPSSDQVTGTPLAPRLSLDQATSALGSGTEVLAAAAFRARDIATIDPRWNLAGDDIVWLVRSIREGDASAGATRPVTVSLVDDATGRLMDEHDLALGTAYRPARLWTIATTKGIDCCAADRYAFVRVSNDEGPTIHEGMIGGGEYGSGDSTTYGPDRPLVLTPAAYTVTVWLAGLDGVAGATPAARCTTGIDLRPLDELMLEAVFPAAGQACAFGPPSPPRLSYFGAAPSP
jgi:hypothetical protein